MTQNAGWMNHSWIIWSLGQLVKYIGQRTLDSVHWTAYIGQLTFDIFRPKQTVSRQKLVGSWHNPRQGPSAPRLKRPQRRGKAFSKVSLQILLLHLDHIRLVFGFRVTVHQQDSAL